MLKKCHLVAIANIRSSFRRCNICNFVAVMQVVQKADCTTKQILAFRSPWGEVRCRERTTSLSHTSSKLNAPSWKVWGCCAVTKFHSSLIVTVRPGAYNVAKKSLLEVARGSDWLKRPSDLSLYFQQSQSNQPMKRNITKMLFVDPCL
jgi:hypothetical protein